MLYSRKQSTTTYPIQFLLVQSIDSKTGATGKTPTVTASKNGAAFGAVSGAVTELSNGWYSWAGNATDRNTLGELSVHVTATGCDPVDFKVNILTVDPFDYFAVNLVQILGTTLTETAGQIAAGFKKLFDVSSPTGTLNSLPSAIPGASGGLPTVDSSNAVKVQSGTGSNQIDLSSGQVKVQSGTGSGQLDVTSGVIKSNLAQILGSALTESGVGRIVAAVKNFFDVATPTGTINSLPAAAPAANGGLPTVDASNAVKVQAGTGSNQIDLSSGQVKVQSGTGAGQLDATLGVVKSRVTAIDNNVITTASINDGAITENKVSSGFINALTTGIWSYLTTEAPFLITNSIGAIILAIKAKTDRLGAGIVVTSSPSSDGETFETNLIISDDYFATEAESLDYESDTWPDLTSGGDATVVWRAEKADGTTYSKAGTVTGAQSVRFEPLKSETADLRVGLSQLFTVVATMANGHEKTLIKNGVLNVEEIRKS